MKKILSIFTLVVLAGFSTAQVTANRFFYELSYKPKVDGDSIIKEMTILDIMPEKSIYRDYLMIAQDSILKLEIEAMQKAGTWKDISKSIKQPKFTHKIYKTYPISEVKYIDIIMQDIVSYTETPQFNWKITSEKTKIGDYNGQKATTNFGGREWTAWFSTEHPFPDGPYKFHGLPGLIVKIEDAGKNYSWELRGNKKVENYDEISYSEKLMKQFGQGIKELPVSREKYEQMYEAYKKDPFGSIRTQLAQIPADMKMPDGTPMSKMIKDQEERLKIHLNENNNTIEIASSTGKSASKEDNGKDKKKNKNKK